MSINQVDKAEILLEALPYIQKYRDKTVVVKYGGNAMTSDELKAEVMKDVVLLHLVGVKVVLVHGGGPDISAMLRSVGKEAVFHNGLRVTDEETVRIVQMVLCGKVNKDLVKLLEHHGGKAVGVSGLDGGMLSCSPLDPVLGYVGNVDAVNVDVINDLLDNDYIPVVSTIGADGDGNVYNVNADTAAAKLAAALHAENLILMTDISGVLLDRLDPSSLVSELTVAHAQELIASGVINGGMIPKTQCCIEAVQSGVGKVIMLDGTRHHSILVEILSDEGVGTMIVA